MDTRDASVPGVYSTLYADWKRRHLLISPSFKRNRSVKSASTTSLGIRKKNVETKMILMSFVLYNILQKQNVKTKMMLLLQKCDYFFLPTSQN